MRWVHLYMVLVTVTMFCRCDAVPKNRKSPEDIGLRSEGKFTIQNLKQFLQMLPQTPAHSLNTTVLSEKLGKNFNFTFSSIEKPSKIYSSSRPQRKKKKASFLSDTKWLKTKLSNKTKAKFERIITKFTTCKIVYDWIDLGKIVFPRYLKSGSCQRNNCSLPPGMTCQASGTSEIKLLLYVCKSSSSIYTSASTATKCKWHEVSVDIITECTCSCSRK